MSFRQKKILSKVKVRPFILNLSHKFGAIWQLVPFWFNTNAVRIIHQDYRRHSGESYGPKKSVNRSDQTEKEEG